MGGIDDDFFSSPFGLGRSPHGLGTAFRYVIVMQSKFGLRKKSWKWNLIIAIDMSTPTVLHLKTVSLILGHIRSTFIRRSRKRKLRIRLLSMICTWRWKKLTVVVWRRWKFRDAYCSQMARRKRRTNMWAYRWSQAGSRAQKSHFKRRAIRRKERFLQISCL